MGSYFFYSICLNLISKKKQAQVYVCKFMQSQDLIVATFLNSFKFLSQNVWKCLKILQTQKCKKFQMFSDLSVGYSDESPSFKKLYCVLF